MSRELFLLHSPSGYNQDFHVLQYQPRLCTSTRYGTNWPLEHLCLIIPWGGITSSVQFRGPFTRPGTFNSLTKKKEILPHFWIQNSFPDAFTTNFGILLSSCKWRVYETSPAEIHMAATSKKPRATCKCFYSILCCYCLFVFSIFFILF